MANLQKSRQQGAFCSHFVAAFRNSFTRLVSLLNLHIDTSIGVSCSLTYRSHSFAWEMSFCGDCALGCPFNLVTPKMAKEEVWGILPVKAQNCLLPVSLWITSLSK